MRVLIAGAAWRGAGEGIAVATQRPLALLHLDARRIRSGDRFTRTPNAASKLASQPSILSQTTVPVMRRSPTPESSISICVFA